MNKDEVTLVLSCGINKDGTLSDDPKQTVKTAVRLFHESSAGLFIFSGYLSYKATFSVEISEAAAMKQYAVMLGIPKEVILVEEDSKDTLGNFYFTKVNFLEPQRIKNLKVVLGPNHSLERVKYISEKVLGPDYHVSFIAQNANRPAEIEREKRSLKLLHEWLEPVTDGDHRAIYKLMKVKHPGYALNSELAHKELEKIVKDPGITKT